MRRQAAGEIRLRLRDVSQSPKTLFLAETFYRYGVLFLFVIMTAGRLNRH